MATVVLLLVLGSAPDKQCIDCKYKCYFVDTGYR